MADNRIVWRNCSVRGSGHLLAILLEPRQILLNEAHKAKIDEHQFHGRVANALPECVGGSVYLMRSRSNGRERIGDGEATVVVSVPIDTDFLTRRFHHFFD